LNNRWDDSSRKQIPTIARTLRAKEVVVHVEEEIE
jgi:hypothetical protein